MPKEHPKMSQKVANMAPTWAQVGAMLGSKIVLDRKKTLPKTTPKKTPKSINLTDKGTGSAIKWKFEDTRRHMEKNLTDVETYANMSRECRATTMQTSRKGKASITHISSKQQAK